jgi:NAD(P)-dependent dehydrogenase (short-subunit alcohol dehydrogenase family)
LSLGPECFSVVRVSLLSFVLGRRGKSGFGYASTAEEVTAGLDLRGTTILVTGANSGLGLESARVLSLRGATIIACARTVESAREACKSLSGEAIPVACELSEPASVRACVQSVLETKRPLDVLLCNAGIMALPERAVKHGQELQFLTNHLGHFALVTGLLGALTDRARVVMLSSSAHFRAPKEGIRFDDLSFERGYSPFESYGQSKLANVLFARALAKRFAGTRKTANAVHPGVIMTNLGRHMGGGIRAIAPIASALAMKNVHEGAATQCYVATHPSLADVSGQYFADCNVARSSEHAQDDAQAERLWTVSEALLAKL